MCTRLNLDLRREKGRNINSEANKLSALYALQWTAEERRAVCIVLVKTADSILPYIGLNGPISQEYEVQL